MTYFTPFLEISSAGIVKYVSEKTSAYFVHIPSPIFGKRGCPIDYSMWLCELFLSLLIRPYILINGPVAMFHNVLDLSLKRYWFNLLILILWQIFLLILIFELIF